VLNKALLAEQCWRLLQNPHQPLNFMVQSHIRILASNAKVKELIESNTKWWNLALLKEIFVGEEVKTITKVPISCSYQINALIWRCNHHMGVFRSQYISPGKGNTIFDKR
jgi:hypothetical protein